MAMTMSMKIMNRSTSKKFQTLMTYVIWSLEFFIAIAIAIAIAIKINKLTFLLKFF